MRVRHLSLTDFRNYASADLDLQTGASLFVGSNGQGKTNLVEAIGYLTILGSHRVSTDAALIRQGSEYAIVRASIIHDDRSVLAEVQINRNGANRAQINRVAAKTRDLPRCLSSVLFAPEDLALVRGEPSGRRRFLDELLVLLTPRMGGVLADYERVLRQRNTLLKGARSSGARSSGTGNGHLITLDIWDERLVQFGSEIISARARLIADLEPHVQSAYRAIAGDSHLAHLRLVTSTAPHQPQGGDDIDGAVPAESDPQWLLDSSQVAPAFVSALARSSVAERDRGLTLVGPHRDDLLLELNGLQAKGYASHGESWSFALALKIASAEVLRSTSSLGDPVLILDDVFAELDKSRRSRLAAAISNYEQILITAAVLEDVPEELARQVVQIRAGEIVESAV